MKRLVPLKLVIFLSVLTLTSLFAFSQTWRNSSSWRGTGGVGGGVGLTPEEKFYNLSDRYEDLPKMPSVKIEGANGTESVFHSFGRRVCVLRAAPGYVGGVLTWWWITPAGGTIVSGNGYSTALLQTSGILDWEVLVRHFSPTADTVTRIVTDNDGHTVGGWIPGSAFFGIPDRPYQEGATDWVVLSNSNQSNPPTAYSFTAPNMGIEFLDSLEVWLRPLQYSSVLQIGFYSQLEWSAATSTNQLNNRRTYLFYRSKRLWRYDWFPYVYWVNSTPVPSVLRWWAYGWNGNWGGINSVTLSPWKVNNNIPTGVDSIESAPTITTNTDYNLEENLYAFTDESVPVKLLFRGYGGVTDSANIGTTNDSLVLQRISGGSLSSSRNGNVGLEYPLNDGNLFVYPRYAYNPLDTSYWSIKGVFADTSTSNLLYVCRGSSGDEAPYRIASKKLGVARTATRFSDSAYAYYLGNPTVSLTGTEDNGNAYYGRATIWSKIIAYMQLVSTGMTGKRGGGRCWGMQFNDPIKFTDAVCVGACKWKKTHASDARRDTVTWEASGCGLVYTMNLFTPISTAKDSMWTSSSGDGWLGITAGSWGAACPASNPIATTNLTASSVRNNVSMINEAAHASLAWVLPFATSSCSTFYVPKKMYVEFVSGFDAGSTTNMAATDSIVFVKYVPSNGVVTGLTTTANASYGAFTGNVLGGFRAASQMTRGQRYTIPLNVSTYMPGQNTFLMMISKDYQRTCGSPTGGAIAQIDPYDSQNYQTGRPDQVPRLIISFSDSLYPIPIVAVTLPNGAESWSINTPQTITWTSTGGPVLKYDILYSKDGGSNYNTTIVSGLPGTALSYSWTPVLADTSSFARVKVRAYGSATVEDASNANFTVATSSFTAYTDLIYASNDTLVQKEPFSWAGACTASGADLNNDNGEQNRLFNVDNVSAGNYRGYMQYVTFNTADSLDHTWTPGSILDSVKIEWTIRSAGLGGVVNEGNVVLLDGDVINTRPATAANASNYFNNVDRTILGQWPMSSFTADDAYHSFTLSRVDTVQAHMGGWVTFLTEHKERQYDCANPGNTNPVRRLIRTISEGMATAPRCTFYWRRYA